MEFLFKALLFIAKLMLLLLGLLLIGGGGLAGLCGLIAKEGAMFVFGFLAAAGGLILFIAVIRNLRRSAATPVADDPDREQQS